MSEKRKTDGSLWVIGTAGEYHVRADCKGLGSKGISCALTVEAHMNPYVVERSS